MAEKEETKFDFLMFKRLFRIMSIIFPGFLSLPSGIFMLLLLICFLEQFLKYNVGLISSRFYKVLGERDFDNFLYTSLTSFGWVLSIAAILGLKRYISSVLYVIWREVLCRSLHTLYFSRINYYSLNVYSKKLDNPDQRITQDVDKLCKELGLLVATVIISPFEIGYYTYQTFRVTGWVGPSLIFGFFLFGTLVNKCIMSPIVPLVVKQERCEGDFRFKHMQIRMSSESIAFYSSGSLECIKTNEVLYKLVKAQSRLFFAQMWLSLSQYIFDYMGSIISFVAIAVPIFSGVYDDLDGPELSSVISKNSFICMTLMYCFSKLVDLSTQCVAIAGTTHRVAQLLEELVLLQEQWDLAAIQAASSYTNLTQQKFKELPSTDKEQDDTRNLLQNDVEDVLQKVYSSDKDSIEKAFILHNVTIMTPNTEKLLVKDLNLEITKGNHLIIMGPSSSGKSSLLRVIRGLWPVTSGTVGHNFVPGPKSVMFLPQKPFLTNGSFLEQIIYPLEVDPNELPSDDAISGILSMISNLHMDNLLQRAGGLFNDPLWIWEDILSPGEMQRVCFLRIFYHQPQYAILDEATSALSSDVEKELYEKCLELGITLISVGHREALLKYHLTVLQLNHGGSWTIEPIQH